MIYFLINRVKTINNYSDYDVILSLINDYEVNGGYILDGVEYKKPEIILNPKLSYKELENIEDVDSYVEELRKKLRTEILSGKKVILTLHDYFTLCPCGGFYDYKSKKVCNKSPMSLKCILCNCDKRNYPQKIWRVIRHYWYFLR